VCATLVGVCVLLAQFECFLCIVFVGSLHVPFFLCLHLHRSARMLTLCHLAASSTLLLLCALATIGLGCAARHVITPHSVTLNHTASTDLLLYYTPSHICISRVTSWTPCFFVQVFPQHTTWLATTTTPHTLSTCEHVLAYTCTVRSWPAPVDACAQNAVTAGCSCATSWCEPPHSAVLVFKRLGFADSVFFGLPALCT
jgi:hypothetical protein